MSNISGYVEVEIEKTTGNKEIITVDGSEFGLEEGGDWTRDPDDQELYAGFLFIAFCGGFNLILSIHIHGNVMTNYDLSVGYENPEEFDIENVVIVNDELEVANIYPSEGEDID